MGTVGLLLLSVGLSAGRNSISKKIAATAGERASFFLSQMVLFFTAAVLLAACNLPMLTVSCLTWLYGVTYGLLLVLSQWMFTLSLRTGAASVCSVVYALGFLLPTLSGVLFWGEDFALTQGLGVVLAVGVILLTFKKSSGTHPGRYIPFLLVAMTASGGLGIMQKVQQVSPVAGEKGAFLVIAFLLAGGCSLAALCLCCRRVSLRPAVMLYPAAAGLCFGGANLCNTLLAGRLPSAVFFSLQNISTILLSTILGVAVFRERLTARTVLIVLLGALVVWLCSG